MTNEEAQEVGRTLRALVDFTPVQKADQPIVSLATLEEAFGLEHAIRFRVVLDEVIRAASRGVLTLEALEAMRDADLLKGDRNDEGKEETPE